MKRFAIFLMLLVSLCVWSPAEAASAKKLTLSPTVVAGGGTVKATLSLASKATGDGEDVTFASSSSYADLASTSVTINAGKSSASVYIKTNTTTVKRTATISATAGGVTRTATLTIDPVGIASVKAQPTLLTSDSTVVGTVTLNGVAPSGGYVVALSDDSAVVDTATSVTIKAGAKSAPFTIVSEPVTSSSTAVVTASAAGLTKSTTITVAPLAMSKLAASGSLTGGNKGTGKITFNGLTSGEGATVALSSSIPSLLQVPPAVTAGANVSTVSFPLTTSTTTTQRSVVITATYQGVTKTFTVAVKPATISSIAASPRSIVGSQPGVLTVNLTGPAPAGGLVATLTSDDQRLSIPATVTFAPGVVTMPVPVETELFTQAKVITLSAVINGTTKTTSVTAVPISVSAITMSSSIVGGNGTTLKFSLNAPAPDGGITVQLASSDPAVISLPDSIEFGAGQRDVVITYVPAVVSVDTPVNISATYGSITKTVTATVKPSHLLNVNLNSSASNGGRFVEAIFTLNGPAPEEGATISLAGTIYSPANAEVPVELPASVVVPAGERSLRVQFDLTAVPVKTITTITASSGGKTVIVRLTVSPPVLQDFTPSPLVVRPGNVTAITVRLSGRAPAGGVVVTLTSAQPTVASVPATVTIPAGAQSVTVNVTGGANAVVGTSTTIRVSALGKSYQGVAVISNLLITDLQLSTDSVMGGNVVTGTVTLNGSAPAGGIAVSLQVIDDALSVPATVLVPATRTSATFTIATSLVPSPRTVVIYARLANSVRTADLAIGALAPVSLTVNNADLEVGESATATITLNDRTPPIGGASVDAFVFTSNNDALTFPASVTFPRSSSTVSFTVTGAPVAVDTVVVLVVEVNGQTSDNVQLTIRAPRLDRVTVASSEVTGGGANTGTVFLTGPAPEGGLEVNLSSSSPSATTGESVVVPAGASSKTFPIATTAVSVNTFPVITATFGGVSKTAVFTVLPPRLTGLTIEDNDIEGGYGYTYGTVTLNGPAPIGGWIVALSTSTSGAASVPTTVTVPAGSAVGTFTVGSSLVPADVTVTITAAKGTDSFTREITVRQIKVSGLSLSVSTVQGGISLTGTVTINRAVPSGGVPVSLTTTKSTVSLPATVTVPAGQTTATFTVTSVAVPANSGLQITAAFNGGSATANMTVLAPVITEITVSPTTLIGGSATATGTVTISHPAPSGGFPIDLDASNGGASIPATVTVAAGATSATFTISTAVVSADRSVTITASRNAVVKSTVIVVQPLVVSALTVTPATVLGGSQNATGTVTLNGKAPEGGATVTLLSSHTTHATVPTTVTVPAGATSATFTVTTQRRATSQSVTISATYNESSQTATIQVNAPTPTGLSLTPSSVTGGASVTGTVTISAAAPTGGMAVALSSNSSFATTPASVTVAAGQTTANFTVSTLPIGANTTVTITATANGVAKTATFNVAAPVLNSISLSSNSVVGGTTLTATAVISSAAPAGGLTIAMSGDKAQAVPANITIAAGQTTGTASVTTQTVASSTLITITGTLNGTSKTATVTLTAVTLNSISLSTSTVLGGQSLTATAVISAPAPAGGITITMSDDKPQATVTNIVIGAGQTQGTTTITTQGVSVNTLITVSATYNGVTRTATFTINRTTVAGVSVNPTSVRGGNSFTFTVTLNGVAPAGGISLYAGDTSNNISMPSSITIPAGSSSVTITVATTNVYSNQTQQVGVYFDDITYYVNLTLTD